MSEIPQDVMPTPQSDLQAQLIQSGAQAQTVDTAAMIAHMQAMQEQYEAKQDALIAEINKLKTERGIPLDSIAAAKTDLLSHVMARAAQYPYDDFSEVIKAVQNLPEISDEIKTNHTALVHDVVSEFVDGLPHKELGYLKVLSRVLHRGVMEKLVSAVV